MTYETTTPVQSLVDDALTELENLADDLDGTYPGREDGDGLRRAAKLIRRQQAALTQPAAQVATRHENYKAALEDIAAVLRQSSEWGADQLHEIVAILGREGIPVSD